MKAYYNQQKISSGLQNFFTKFFSLSKPHLKLISFIITGIICAESVVTSDISRKLKDDFSLVNLGSIERRFRRFFLSFSAIAYTFFESFIRFLEINLAIILKSVLQEKEKASLHFDYFPSSI